MGIFERIRGIELKTDAEFLAMRVAGLVVADALAAVRTAVVPGVTTGELDAVAHDVIRSAGAVPSFLGYPYSGDNDFPATICASVNDEIVHGIPGDRRIAAGDLVSIDCGAIVDGWHGDAAISVIAGGEDAGGEDPAETERRRTLIAVTEQALWAGVAQVRDGNRIGDIGAAVAGSVQSHPHRYGIVDNCTGHGIGSAMHMPPDVPNLGKPGHGPRLSVGMAICIEPMITLGSADNQTLDDDWTMVTLDGSAAAHAEHTIALTSRGAWVLTAPDGGAAMLAALEVPFGGLD